jgi:Flp pilus assembly pilin Flp
MGAQKNNKRSSMHSLIHIARAARAGVRERFPQGFFRTKSAAAAIEYGIVLSLISIVALVAVRATGVEVERIFDLSSNSLSNATTGPGNEGPQWLTPAGELGPFMVDDSISVQLEAEVDSGSPDFSLVSGDLPDGVTLDPNGLISGSPTQAGSYAFTARVTDGEGRTADRSFSIDVVANFVEFIEPGQHGWTVPDGVTKIYVAIWGGGGGGPNGVGGGGASAATATMDVTPGQSMTIWVGGGGGGGISGPKEDRRHGGVGYRPGGYGGDGIYPGGGGGGASALLDGSTPILVVGGGGGGAMIAHGGASQGSTGADGDTFLLSSGHAGGGGGAQENADGAGGVASGDEPVNGQPGSVNGGGDGASAPDASGAAGGGGGGGWYSGGGGSRTRLGSFNTGGGGGGGGSSFIDFSRVTTGTLHAGSGRTPGNDTDWRHPSEVGRGGHSAPGGDGYIRIDFQ